MNSTLLVLLGFLAVTMVAGAGSAAVNAGKGDWFIDLFGAFVRIFVMNIVFMLAWFPAFFANDFVWAQATFMDIYKTLIPPAYVKAKYA